MGTYYTLYCEARVGGVWHNIDFYQRPLGGTLTLVPVIEGQSAIGSALRWYAEDSPIRAESISEVTRNQESPNAEDWQWSVIPGIWFTGKDFDAPEYCGYFHKQDVRNYQSGLIDRINEDDMLDTESYLALPDDGKVSYMYFEYTEPWGLRDVMRRIKSAVELRMLACATWLFNIPKELRGDMFSVGWEDVRVVICQS